MQLKWIDLKKEMKKIRPVKNTWYDWLINYITEPMRKSVGGFKDKIVSLFKTNKQKQTMFGEERNQLNQRKNKILKSFSIRKEQRKIKDGIFRGIRTLG